MQHTSNALRVQTKDVWISIKNVLCGSVSNAEFDSWIAPLNAEISDNQIRIIAPNQFVADFIKRSFMDKIAHAAKAFDMVATLGAGNISNDNLRQTFTPATSNLSPTTTKFITSEVNSFALSAVNKMCGGAVSFSPLFIHGAAGSGKSTVAKIVSESAKGKTLCMTGAQFVSEFLRSMNEHSVFAFKDFMRRCDNLIIEDVQALIGKRASCEEFQVLLSDMIKAGKNILITSNAAPSALTFDRGLQSLLASGLTADLTGPDVIVREQMMANGGVPSKIANALANQLPADGHIVSGVVKKIIAYKELMGEVDMEIAMRLVSDVVQKTRSNLSLAREMASKIGIPFEEIESASRSRAVARARQMIMFALKKSTRMTLSEIGRIFNRNHATVLHAIATIESALLTDLVMNAEIEQLISVQ